MPTFSVPNYGVMSRPDYGGALAVIGDFRLVVHTNGNEYLLQMISDGAWRTYQGFGTSSCVRRFFDLEAMYGDNSVHPRLKSFLQSLPADPYENFVGSPPDRAGPALALPRFLIVYTKFPDEVSSDD